MISDRVGQGLAVLGVLLAASTLGGCSGGGSSSSSGLGTSSGPGATSASVVRSASVGPVSVPPTSASRAPTTYDFQTANHNIACSMAPSGVRCDIKTHTWTPPAKPASCQNDWAGGMQVATKAASFTCAGDTLLGKGATTGRNTIVRNAGYVCAVVTTTVTCTNPAGHGFKLSIAYTSTF